MKTISRPWRYLLDGHLADTIMCRTYKRPGVKNFATKNLAGNGGGLASGWNGKLGVVPPAEKYSASIFSRPGASMKPGASKKRESGSANVANIEQAQNSLTALHGLSPVQPEVFVRGASQPKNISLDMGGFSNIMLLAHPLAIVYITSCQQDNPMIYVSPQIASMGITPEAWLGKPDFRLQQAGLQQVHDEDSLRVEQAFRHSCATAEMFSCHYRLYVSSGKVRWFHDEASVTCDESGAPLFIRGVMLDITDRKEMEAELALHRYYLEQGVEMRTGQLAKRTAILESCNKALCDKLALAQKDIAMFNRQLAKTMIGKETKDCAVQY